MSVERCHWVDVNDHNSINSSLFQQYDIGGPSCIAFWCGLTFVFLLSIADLLTFTTARDDTLPFSNYFKIVHPALRMPTRALEILTVVPSLLLLAPICSVRAFNTFLSLAIIAP